MGGMVGDATAGSQWILHLCVQLSRYGYSKMRMRIMIQLNCAHTRTRITHTWCGPSQLHTCTMIGTSSVNYV